MKGGGIKVMCACVGEGIIFQREGRDRQGWGEVDLQGEEEEDDDEKNRPQKPTSKKYI